MLRSPPFTPDSEALATRLADNATLQWHTLNCELVTPMYGGGVHSTQVDAKMPIRASSIRGQLRFWWRLLAKYQWQLGDDKAIRKAEFELWGGMNDGNDEGKASKVLLRVENINNLIIEPCAIFETKPNGNGYKTLPTPKDWAKVPYVLFPAQGKKPDSPKAESPHSLAKAGLTWDLKIALISNPNEKQQIQIWETLRWWANFGGIGARTRRGLGAVYIKADNEAINLNPLTHDDIEKIQGFKLVTRPPVNQREWTKAAYQAWKESVDKLSSFRQVNVGRLTNSNRSRWAEPDAIRHHTNQTSARHSQRVTDDNIFPRAAFGLPIIFKFQNDGNARSDEPAQTSLQPIYNNHLMERMSSPLILRPYYNGNGWQASALLLPYDYTQLNLKLIQGHQEIAVVYGQTSQFTKLKPIEENGGGDPLQAFLTYFAK